MNIPVCPSNHVVVEIESKFREQIVTESGLQLYQDTSYRPEHHATVLGRVVSLPRSVNGRDWPLRSQIVPEVAVGDEIAFSYLTVFDIQHRDDEDSVYYEDPTDRPQLSQYSNRKGETIFVGYRWRDDLFDVASYDAAGHLVDRKEGLTDEQKDGWLGAFPFAATTQITYNNLIELEGRDFWKVDMGHVLAVRRGDLLIPIGGHVILDMPLPETQQQVGRIQLLNPVYANRSENQAESQLIAIGTPLKGRPVLGVKPGDYVVYDDRYAQHYELWGKDVIVMRQDRLLAKK